MGTKKLKKLDILKITDLEIPNRDLQSKAENTVIFPVYLQPISNLCDKFYSDIHIPICSFIAKCIGVCYLKLKRSLF